MTHQHRSCNTAFFVLSVWEERLGGQGGHTEWRGEVLDVDCNLAHQFSDWPELIDLIADALDKLRQNSSQQREEIAPR